MKIKAIAIDDEQHALEVIQFHADKIPFLSLSGCFRNPFEALNFIKDNEVDVVFLDIDMPDIKGIKFARLLGSNPMIIFTTAYTEFAVESYELNTVDYLVKPIELDRFTIAVNKAYKMVSLINYTNSSSELHSDSSVFIKSGSDSIKVGIETIEYVQCEGNYMFFYLKDGARLLSRMTVFQVLQVLPANHFCQIHRSYIINKSKIESVKNNFVKIKNKSLPIGGLYKRDFLRELNLI